MEGDMDLLWLKDMFVLSLPVIEKIVRPVIVYFFLLVGLRLAGKRELAQLNSSDLVVLLMLSNTVQNAIIGDDNSVSGGLIGAAALLLVNYLTVRYLYRHRRLDALVEGKTDFLIRHGKLNKALMESELITELELRAAARRQGIFSLAAVENATLEPDGAVSFSLREPAPEEKRHAELLERIDTLAREVEALRAQLPKA
jgi:uncharacterized membrane protein YcaP (DUF421 family)